MKEWVLKKSWDSLFRHRDLSPPTKISSQLIMPYLMAETTTLEDHLTAMRPPSTKIQSILQQTWKEQLSFKRVTKPRTKTAVYLKLLQLSPIKLNTSSLHPTKTSSVLRPSPKKISTSNKALKNSSTMIRNTCQSNYWAKFIFVGFCINS
jgi:hypothetical protein